MSRRRRILPFRAPTASQLVRSCCLPPAVEEAAAVTAAIEAAVTAAVEAAVTAAVEAAVTATAVITVEKAAAVTAVITVEEAAAVTAVITVEKAAAVTAVITVEKAAAVTAVVAAVEDHVRDRQADPLTRHHACTAGKNDNEQTAETGST